MCVARDPSPFPVTEVFFAVFVSSGSHRVVYLVLLFGEKIGKTALSCNTKDKHSFFAFFFIPNVIPKMLVPFACFELVSLPRK